MTICSRSQPVVADADATGDRSGQILNLIATNWSVVRLALNGPADDARAQRTLLERYGGAIRRYLLGALRDADLADELFQEFALRFLQGKMRGASSRHGRFRDFVKGTLCHLIADLHRNRVRRPRPLPLDRRAPVVESDLPSSLDSEFLSSWRDEILARAWSALADYERSGGQPFYSALRARVDRPELRSSQLAAVLATQLGKPVTAEGARQLLHRAREKFGELLIREVADSLANPSNDNLEQELIDLGLLEYCQHKLPKREHKRP